MSVYFVKGKGWRYDFTLNGQRYTRAWFETKKQAREAERERSKGAIKDRNRPSTPTDMDFLELVNRRLDYVKAYNSHHHYRDYLSMARRWTERWGNA